MTWTNQYNVPAGQTGALVTATYTDTNNCGAASPATTTSANQCYSTNLPTVTSSCSIWTFSFTNSYNVPAGQAAPFVTATYTDTNDCHSIQTTVPTTVCGANKAANIQKAANGCSVWTMTFTNQCNVPAGQTGALVTATYTDTNNCNAAQAATTTTAPAAPASSCFSTTVASQSTSCPIWTMTFTNQYNIPAGQTGALVTATNTDFANCVTTQVQVPTTTCVAGSGKMAKDAAPQGCPVWTMTFTNQYDVPAGQTGALVTALYTDVNNCGAKKVITSIPPVYVDEGTSTSTSIPAMDTETAAAATATDSDASATGSDFVDIPQNAVIAYVDGSVDEDTGDLDTVCTSNPTISIASNNTLSLSTGELGYFNQDGLFVFDSAPSADDVMYSGGWSVSGDYYLLLGDQSVFLVCLTDDVDDGYVIFVDTDDNEDDDGCVEAMLKLQSVSC
ncbi:unnamed protein product [Ambrosiozyma monospora]|uniref:Unnamed protein product n=1 Tax=Ambrosiozyma monospora TaxID=43982 RepID=A0A9W6YVC4_AMBMO|nr:unnamed protein product [Ambrosiozyma monospora]